MELPINTIVKGDCIDILAGFPEKAVDLVFADPPYNLQLEQELWRPNQTRVDAVDDDWDQFNGFAEYDRFTEAWLRACRRVLKDTGSIWVIGSYHNIFRIGKIMMDIGYWTLNDVIWVKTNPMPNFRGVRFTNAHETLIWAKRSKKQKKYTFNHHAMKMLNDEKQMRSDWEIPLCTGKERCTINGKKAHSTQKPEALLYRIISSTSNPGDIVLDPFMGSGTTGAVAKKLRRQWVGIEKEEKYIRIARDRIDGIQPLLVSEEYLVTPSRRALPRVPFGNLLETGYVQPGQKLFSHDRTHVATIASDGSLVADGFRGSIHKVGAQLQEAPACNGWTFWHYEGCDRRLETIDVLRTAYREEAKAVSEIRDA